MRSSRRPPLARLRGDLAPRALTEPEMVISSFTIERDLAAVDWAATPLGPRADWPQSLRIPVRTMLGSRFAMWMAWGPDLTFFCNDAYRRDTLGSKYPWALGRPAREVWAEIWPEIGPRIDQVIRTGVATWDEGLRLYLERSGYPEETYHTFSYSPLDGENGSVTGMLCVVREDTDRVISARRMATLQELGTAVSALLTPSEVYAAACDELGRNRSDFPFALFYVTAEEDKEEPPEAVLACAVGIDAEHPAAPPRLQLGTDTCWPFPLRHPAVIELEGRFADLPSGDQPEPPTHAMVLPLVAQPGAAPRAWLVAGLNRFRPLDDGYRGFLELIARQVSAAVAAASAFEHERHRAEQLAELDRAKTAFFTNVSHELRTPLTLMLGPVTDALADREHPLDPRHRARLEVAERSAHRLLGLVNTLLDFSRLEAGRVEPNLEPMDLARHTADLAGMFESVADQAGLTLRVDVPARSAPVQMDRDLWTKIVLNLLSNAVKFTFTGGISVELRLPGPESADGDTTGSAELIVRDTGIGIDPADQEHLFERFRRVKGARSRSHEGSGIGLALVAELADLLGGAVQVESAVGVGSAFTVRVPVHRVQPGDGPISSEPEPDGRHYVEEAARWVGEPEALALLDGVPASLDGDRPCVLVVEDNPDMRSYLASLLAGTYRVELAVDGADALRRIERQLPDLVLTDVMMPNVDGVELLAALRASPRTAELPVIMVSARGGEDGVYEGLEAGADDYLTKPFSARELLARVRTNLEFDRAKRAITDAAARQVAAREHQIAEELQASLLPALDFDPDHLEVASFYQSGVEGTQVGGDWYDVIELGAGRTALVIGDVMGRGVRAAAVMGQLRTAIRAYARLDLPPADVLELCDSAVRDMGEDQIVTCVYAVFDPVEHRLTFANAGHLPPLLVGADGSVERLLAGAGAPLGTGSLTSSEESVPMTPGMTLALYTDGLVERRDRDIDAGIAVLATELAASQAPLEEIPACLVARMLPDGQDDDVGLLLARIPLDGPVVPSVRFAAGDTARTVAAARHWARRILVGWDLGAERCADAELLIGELVTNALTHGAAPVEVRLRHTREALMIEVSDEAPFLPRRLRPAVDDERGRGLMLVAELAQRWGVRPIPTGKAVWCVISLNQVVLV